MIQERLASFLFEPERYLGDSLPVARYRLEQVLPLRDFKESDYAQSLDAKLLLLYPAEWQLLGFGCALLPFIGEIERSMDGRFRRAVRARLSEEQVRLFDSISLTETSPAFLLPRNVWTNPDTVMQAGCTNLMQWASWSDAQRAYMELRHPMTSPAISPITNNHIEVLCQILLPNHSWLLHNQASI